MPKKTRTRKPWSRYKDPRYIPWRNAVLARDQYTCQHCLKRSEGKRGLIAHHIRSYARYKALRYEVSNGLTLCPPCHYDTHAKRRAARVRRARASAKPPR